MSKYINNKLLNSTENRRLNFIYLLANSPDRVFLSELAKLLNVSDRVLKNDLVFFRNEFDDFVIDTSRKGIKLTFNDNKNLSDISKKLLEHSIPYQLLEKIFLDETKSVNQLAEDLFISVATTYRTINDINTVLDKYNVVIDTNPCKIVGNETALRYLAYLYFYERYSHVEWPFLEYNEKIINDFLKTILQFDITGTSYASLSTLKSTVMINLVRYKHKHFVKNDYIATYCNSIYNISNEFRDVFKNFEDNTEVTINDQFIMEIFYPFFQKNYFHSYPSLYKASKSKPLLASEITYLNNFLDEISEKYDIPLTNKKAIILTLHNAAFLENQELLSSYIFYDQHGRFVEKIAEEFPLFYKDLYHGISGYRKLIQAPLTKKGNHYLLYMISTHWLKLIPNLLNKYDTIKTLVISDGLALYANLLEDFLNYEYSKQLKTEIYTGLSVKQDLLEKLPHELIISNFSLPVPKGKELVYIENLPNSQDLSRIESAINRILSKRNNK